MYRTSYSLARSVVIDACVQADIDAKLITFFRAKSIASMPEQSGELTLVLINADMATAIHSTWPGVCTTVTPSA